jgi:hypothetical protein
VPYRGLHDLFLKIPVEKISLGRKNLSVDPDPGG